MEDDHVRGVKGDRERSGGGEGLFGEDLDKVSERVDTGGERAVLNDIVGGTLHDGCFEGENGLFAEG